MSDDARRLAAAREAPASTSPTRRPPLEISFAWQPTSSATSISRDETLSARLLACLVPIAGFLVFRRSFLRGGGLGGAIKS